MPDILWLILPLVLLYFLMIRPAQARAKEQQKTLSDLAAGTRIMMASGIYGTVRHVGEKQLIVEVSPGVELTIIKAAVAKVVGADEDEFEYEDAAGPSDEEQAEALAVEDGMGGAIGSDASQTFTPDPSAEDKPRPGTTA